MRKTFDMVALLAIVALSFGLVVIGILLAAPRNADSPTANDLLLDGFRILDPDGRDIERFRGDDYWTTEPKSVTQIGDRTT